MWLFMAVLSAFFAGLTSILAKCGIRKTDSDVATALRTMVVLAFSWIMVFVVDSAGTIGNIGSKSLVFLVLSGIATGASWICYFKALSIGDVNKVVPIDKSSTILSVLLAIVMFQETDHLAVKLTGTAILAAGIFLMIDRKKDQKQQENNNAKDKNKDKSIDKNKDNNNGNNKGNSIDKSGKWMVYAIFSAIFAALTSILAKIGIEGVESNLGTAIRTGVVLVMAWLVVFMKGKQKAIKTIDHKELISIFLSGLATGGSWLCYYYAIQNGIVSVVVPIDKLSIVVTVLFSYLVFQEKLSKKAFVGLCLMAAGTLVMAIQA